MDRPFLRDETSKQSVVISHGLLFPAALLSEQKKMCENEADTVNNKTSSHPLLKTNLFSTSFSF